MISNVMLDLEAIQLSTADVILQDWYPDVIETNSDKLKKAMLHELNELKQYDVYEEVNIKSLSAEQRSGPTGEVSTKARLVGKGYTQSVDPELIYAGTSHMSAHELTQDSLGHGMQEQLGHSDCRHQWSISSWASH
eukprot:673849-Amphidinium_carterae.2